MFCAFPSFGHISNSLGFLILVYRERGCPSQSAGISPCASWSLTKNLRCFCCRFYSADGLFIVPGNRSEVVEFIFLVMLGIVGISVGTATFASGDMF